MEGHTVVHFSLDGYLYMGNGRGRLAPFFVFDIPPKPTF